jgi:hypothetical protein
MFKEKSVEGERCDFLLLNYEMPNVNGPGSILMKKC